MNKKTILHLGLMVFTVVLLGSGCQNCPCKETLGNNKPSSQPAEPDLSKDIIVAGKIKNPGMVTFEEDEPATVLRAIIRAGGFTENANKTKVNLLRYIDGQTQVTEIDVESVMKKGGYKGDVHLKHADIIFIDKN